MGLFGLVVCAASMSPFQRAFRLPPPLQHIRMYGLPEIFRKQFPMHSSNISSFCAYVIHVFQLPI